MKIFIVNGAESFFTAVLHIRKKIALLLRTATFSFRWDAKLCGLPPTVKNAEE